MSRIYLVGVICWLGFIAGCAPVGDTPGDSAVVTRDASARLQLSARSPENPRVRRVLVTFTHVEVYSTEQQAWRTVVDYGEAGRTLDLMTLQGGNTDELGAFNLEPGTYEQVRLHLKADNQIEVDEGNGPVLHPLKVPSGEQSGLKLVRAFTVTGKGATELTVEFDVEKSVKHTGRGWQLKPTIKVIGVTSAESSMRLIGPEGGTVRLLNEGQIDIPAGALAQETELSIRAVELLPEQARRQALLPSTVLAIGPIGTTFNRPVRVTLWYDPAELGGRSLSQMAFLASGDQGGWVERPTTFDPALGTLSGEVTRLEGVRRATTVDSVLGTLSEGESMFAGGDKITAIVVVRSFDQPSTPLALKPGDSRKVEALLYHKDCDIPGCAPVEGREISWTHAKGGSSSQVAVDYEWPCAGIPEDRCESVSHCLWDGLSCISNGRFAALTAQQYPGATLNVNVEGSEAIGSTVQPVMGVRVRFHTMHVNRDGDNVGSGELYWWMNVNDFTVHQGDQDGDGGDTFGLGGCRFFALRPEDSLTVHADVREDDGGLNGGTDQTWFYRTYSSSNYWGGSESGRSYDENTDQGDDGVDVNVRYSITLATEVGEGCVQ